MKNIKFYYKYHLFNSSFNAIKCQLIYTFYNIIFTLLQYKSNMYVYIYIQLMSSSLNTLIGTFSSIDINNSNTTIDSSNLICIDTSNNRIGINTIDPSCSIHIINTSNSSNISNAIKTPKLYITDISEISIGSQTLSGNAIFDIYEVYCDISGYLRLRIN